MRDLEAGALGGRTVQGVLGWSKMVQDGPRWSKMVQESKMLKVFGGLVPHLFSKA